MTLQQLEYILAVNQFRHFAKAAEYCRITQPTLSAMGAKLEKELDVRLFERSNKTVKPTVAGSRLRAGSPAVVAVTEKVALPCAL